MLDWKVEEDRGLEPPGDEWGEVEPRNHWRGWLLLTIAGFALLAAFWWGVTDGALRMERDLEAFVLEEERARLASMDERVAQLVAPDVPAWWRAAYRDTFDGAHEGKPVDFEINEITFHSGGALVKVRMGQQEQLRFYRRSKEGWRRAPVPLNMWGNRQTRAVGDRWTLSYYARDAVFAERLEMDLPALFHAAETLADRPVRASILVRPIEHRLLGEDPSSLIEVTTPDLVPLDGRLSGPSRVRLALAKSLLRRSLPSGREPGSIPNFDRFLNSLHHVVAIHWALDETAQRRMRAGWRTHFAKHPWQSPLRYPKRGLQTNASESHHLISMHLLVDYLYQTHGIEPLAEMLQQYRLSSDWNALFQATLGKSVLEVEKAVAAYAAGQQKTAVSLEARVEEVGDESVLERAKARNVSEGESSPFVDVVRLVQPTATGAI